MRMSKKMREIKAQISELLPKLQNAIDEMDAEKATELRGKLEDLNSLYAAAEAEFAASQDGGVEPDGADGKKGVYDALTFYKAICHGELNASERELVENAKRIYKDKFSEGSKPDGGLTVPDDLSKEIFESIRDNESVRTIVSVENVNSATGTRIWRGGDSMKLYNTAEYEEIKELNNPNYSLVKYDQKKFAGIMPVSSELLEDSFINFRDEIVTWMSECARNTENAQILYGVGGEKHCEGMLSTAGAYMEVSAPAELTIDFLRGVYSKLKSGYRANAIWLMNTDMFNAILELKDGNNRSYLHENPKNEAEYILFNRPVVILDAIETDEENKTILAFGDFKRAYRMFPRREFGISFTDIAAGAWETDSVKAKGTARFDGRVMDRQAAIIIRDMPVSPLEVNGGADELTGEMTEATLKNLTKAQLLDIAADLGVEGVTTDSLKNDIVTAILNTIKG